MKFFAIVFCLVMARTSAQCSEFRSNPIRSMTNSVSTDTLPTVFMIGQFSDPFEKLNSSARSLLEISQNDVYLAYDKWLDMLSELSSTADHLSFNLKGAKFWCSVYWNADGTIKHFAYYPKSGSINIDHDAFKKLLITFIANYKMPIATDAPYYNYGSVVFPIPVKKQVATKN